MRSARIITAIVATVGLGTLQGHAIAAGGNAEDSSAKPLTLAVIGDVPYGTEQEAAFGQLVDAINSDPNVRIAVHVGDIKNGSTECTDARFAAGDDPEPNRARLVRWQ